jgi:DNA primase
MFNKKNLAIVVLPLLLASFLFSQSVTELAKKEKERRAAMKGKSGAVITNADLAKTKKKPAVEVAEPDKPAAEAQASGEAAPPAGQQGTAAPAAGQPAAGEKPAEPKPAPADETTLAEKDFKARLNELATKAKDAQELVELLTLKMNSLWQEFYNLSDVKSREFTQFQISETYEKLTKAEVDAQKAKKDMDDFLATAKREGVPTIWIK